MARTRLTVEEEERIYAIVEATSLVTGISVRDIIARKHKSRLKLRPRREMNKGRLKEKTLLESHRIFVSYALAEYVAKVHAGMSFPKIGTFFGRDHASIMYTCNRVAENFEEYRPAIMRIVSFLGNSSDAAYLSPEDRELLNLHIAITSNI